MRVSDILADVQSKGLSYLLPFKKIPYNLVDTLYYLFLKIRWKGDGDLTPSSFAGNLDWKDPQENSLTQKQMNQTVNFPSRLSLVPRLRLSACLVYNDRFCYYLRIYFFFPLKIIYLTVF